MQKTPGSLCLGPVKTLLLFRVGAFAYVLDESGRKKDVAPLLES